MDPLTHGLVGAAAGQSFSEKKTARAAAFSGAAAGMLADLDIFIHYPGDPLFNIEVHRQFTHSLIFIPFGALIAAGLLWLVLKKELHFRKVYLFSFAGYATSGLLDSFTSYGTQLLWPFLDTRFAWNLISVIDPVMTVGLIIFLGFAIWKQNKRIAWGAGGWLIFFLLFGWVQHNRAMDAAKSLAASRGHIAETIVVKPTIGNQVLWRSNYIYDNQIYADAIRTGLIRGLAIYEGESQPAVSVESEYSHFKGTILYNDLKRFEKLSDRFLVRHPDKPDIIGDARYSMLPTKMTPLWGVKVDSTDPGGSLSLLYFRDTDKELRDSFWGMLIGREEPG